MQHVVRYRRRVVRENLEASFPEKNKKELRRIEKDFYAFFCDYVVETWHLRTMGAGEMERRMTFEGVEAIEKELEQKNFVFIYLGHYGNWEWVSSLPLATHRPTTRCAQLYRPLRNKRFDRMFLKMRSKFGAENVSKYDSLRRIMQMKRDGEKTIIGFISDQSPNPGSIHEWVDFLHHDTPVFTGTERIGKKVDAAVYFADITRPERGHYHCSLRHVTSDIRSIPDYQLTDTYMRDLEAMIRRQPALWLWSHKRWKHTREKVEQWKREHGGRQ